MHSSSQAVNRELQLQIVDLQRQLHEVTEELRLCKEKLMFLECHPAVVSALKGETLVANWVNGLTTSHNDAIDVIARGIRIEVKMSSGLNRANKGRNTLRWSWPQILGVGGSKEFDRLILLGGKDQRFFDKYLDPQCPYVIFDIPYGDLVPNQYGILTKAGNAHDTIFLTTNPSTVRSRGAKLLFSKYQTTAAALESDYGMK